MLDGGKCGIEEDFKLPTRKERSSMFKEELIKRTETLLLITDMERLTSNSMSSMLTNGRVHQRRESSTKSSDSMFKETSTSLPDWDQEDISTSSTTETWLSRQETAEKHKSGGSTKTL
jgi:hypothetical protein